jgi:hypothetical protein
MPLNISCAKRLPWLFAALVLPGAVSATDLQIEHVTIVSPERNSPMRDAFVRVHDGRIAAIWKAGGPSARAGRDTNVTGSLTAGVTP